MQSNNSNGTGASRARGFAALWGVVAIGLGLMASPAEAAPFAYVAGGGFGGVVSVIDTATNVVAATVPVGATPSDIAITPDGKHAYVTTIFEAVSVIDTSTNKVVTTINLGFGEGSSGVAIAPDGKRAYVAGSGPTNVSVIDTATNKVVATINVGLAPWE